MQIILLSKGALTLVDDEDYERVTAAGQWHASECDGRLYARHTFRFPDPRGGPALQRLVSLHNFLTGWRFVDHINGASLDNRRENLRPATPTQNGENRGRSRASTSGFKGVTWNARTRTWRAAIQHEGRRYSLRYHATREDAARAYDRAALELHGDFARLNFSREDYL